jgi:mannose/fructose/N-acetylgalactosamine-specific phosphotransferase system component IID
MSGRVLRSTDLWRIALRSSLLQATWNYERQQGVGWAYALEPALQRIIVDPAARRARLADHTAYFNTQPTMASLALGAVAALEEQRLGGDPADDPAPRVKAVLGSSLAALGDRLFWFTLRPFAACAGLLCAVNGGWAGALALWTCYNVVHLGVRGAGVWWGYREGPQVLGEALRRRLERLVGVLATLGAAAIGLIVAMLLAPGGEPRPVVFQATLAAGLALGLFAAQRARPSPTEWALGFGALCVIAGWMR